jgi:putative ABC transport system substrate-binding protein
LVQLNPEVIVAFATIQAVAFKKATSMISIVVPVLAHPIALGLIQSEAHPGGNVMGIAPYVRGLPAKQLELAAKQLQLAREIVPGARRIGVVDDVTDPTADPQRKESKRSGRRGPLQGKPALRTDEVMD